ncbi:hypothetical protein MY11210_009707 [Beauveria gryllotalpidicola]
MLWSTLVLYAASVHGLPQENAQNTGGFNFSAILRHNIQIEAHMADTIKGLDTVLPYSEGPLEASKNEVDLTKIPESERKCLFLRNSMKTKGLKSTLDINPYPNGDDIVTGDDERNFEVRVSKTWTNSKKLGWNKEFSEEVGHSKTLEASYFNGAFSAAFSATFYGNQRTTTGQNSEALAQTEFETAVDEKFKCPPKSICRFVTWTYMRTVEGTCFLTPYYNEQCANTGHGNRYSLGLIPICSPAAEIADEFYNFITRVKDLGGYGPDVQGIKMPKPENLRNVYEQKCSFSYALRYDNGMPVSASANIIQKYHDPKAKKVQVTKVPKALGWRQSKAGDEVCQLEGGWSWLPPNDFYIPRKDGGNGEWARRDDLAEPEGRKDKCPSPIESLSKRAAAEELRRRDAGDNSPVDDNTLEDDEPPAYDLVKVDRLKDGLQDFVQELSQRDSEGFVANPIGKADSSKRALTPREEGSITSCLAEVVKRYGSG